MSLIKFSFKLLYLIFLKSILLTLFLGIGCISEGQNKRILVFSKTQTYRHESIKKAQTILQAWGQQNKIVIDTTENSQNFTENNLKKYNAVIFLNTTGEVLNSRQQYDFERFIKSGGGFIGVHAASDTEYEWPWYHQLVGAYFDGHPDYPNVRKAEVFLENIQHPINQKIDSVFAVYDEFYDFKNLSDNLTFLSFLNPKSYNDSKMKEVHPIAWCHEFDGGRAFYTGLGHDEAIYNNSNFQRQLFNGIKWVLDSKIDYDLVKGEAAPEEDRFQKSTLLTKLDEPIELAVLPNSDVIVVERKGEIKLYDNEGKQSISLGKIDVYHKYEYGLLGITLDPQFNKNGWLYLYYTPNIDSVFSNYLSRFHYDQARRHLNLFSEKIILDVPIKKTDCCHTGGSMAWDEHQNLFLSTGDDTNPGGSDGYSPIDFRKGREGFDALKTAGNTNDLRGKILRIKPLADGSYLVPDGNLFEKNNPKARPEIYVMGCRNPYRISYDKRTKTLYWGDIGPDAGKANTSRGPEGFVEINKTSSPGNFGWPMFVADHKAYNQFDFENKTSGQKFNPQKPINLSPNNTGLKELPKAETAFIYYSYVESAQNPLFGKGGCNPMAGPVYYSQDYKGASAFPSYFDSTFFAYEWMRDWVIGIKTSSLNLKTEKLFTNIQLNHPIDMDFGPDGSLYILDYGVNWFQANSEAALSKIEYIRGNRSPVIKMSVNKTVGGAPLTVQFSSKGTFDPDGDALTYSWFFGTTKSSLQNPKFTFNKSGEHTVKFEVKDAAGNKSSQSLNIIVGNNYPMVRIVVKGNKTFVIPGKSIDYQVSVSDIEDGTLSTGIDKSEVAISQNLIDGYDLAIINQGHQSNLLGLKGKRLIASSDCRACHAESQNSVGPSYKAIAERYPNTAENSKKLIQKIIEGGGGVWGEHNMAAHPDLKESDVKEMLDFILNINKENNNNMPTSGKLTTDATFKNKSWILKATYSDKGNGSIKSLSTTVDYLLRPLRLNAISAEFKWEVGQYIHSFFGEEVTVANANGSYFGYKNIDLTGLKGLKVYAYAEKEYTVGGTLELRLDSPKGPILDSFEIKVGDYFWKEMEFPISVTGQHNVFFVYKNPNPDNKALFGITQIEFLPE